MWTEFFSVFNFKRKHQDSPQVFSKLEPFWTKLCGCLVVMFCKIKITKPLANLQKVCTYWHF